MRNEVFSVCKNKTVIEVGPYHGWHSKLIKENNPAKLTLVEANPNCEDILRSKFPDDTVVYADVFDFYNQNHFVDVVVCCGVLYHLHSPLHLLELIVNKSNPEYIILDSISAPGTQYFDEVDNIPGNRYTSGKWKSCGINSSLPLDITIRALNNLGYKEQLVDDDIKRFKVISKFGWLVVFKKTLETLKLKT
ncbi:MAG: class I SAM-dependent methyltransferase [Bacteriovoracaceae bacterium]|nr:class I SAM-dependent methyltransferase [Bacteriovoracaceae bacterium]